MSPNVLKFILTVIGGGLVAAPQAFPELQPYSGFFIAFGGVLGGGAWIPRPGDTKAGK
jgi:hypothetical protein